MKRTPRKQTTAPTAQTVSCPRCGTAVRFRSHAAVMAVCESCRAGVLKDAASVQDIGTISNVLEDYSPIRIGTAGAWRARHFTVVGRIQLRYHAGTWNRWFVLFADGDTGWLGDSSGLYTIARAGVRDLPLSLPTFDEIEPGTQYSIHGQSVIASDKRDGACIGGQGELPFRIGDDCIGAHWFARVANLRTGLDVVTLDYCVGDMPVVYHGVAVTLSELKCELLRDDEQVKASAGKFRGKPDVLDCPSCGSAITYLAGVTTSLVCPACCAQLDATGLDASVLAAGDPEARQLTTLPLGATASIKHLDYTLVGLMVRSEKQGERWTEYLLCSTQGSFFWLKESVDGWFHSQVVRSWPGCDSLEATSVTLDKTDFSRLHQYTATVEYAAGAFNFHVAVGEQARVHVFKQGQSRLAAELKPSELTWFQSKPVGFDKISAWFGDAISPTPAIASAFTPTHNATLGNFFWLIIVLNAIPLLFNFDDTWIVVIVASMALYAPAAFMQRDKNE